MTKEEILKDIRAIDDKDNPLQRCDNDGKAMLYIVEKTAERTRKETLLEVLNWIEGMYDTDYVAGDIVRMLEDKLKKTNESK